MKVIMYEISNINEIMKYENIEKLLLVMTSIINENENNLMT